MVEFKDIKSEYIRLVERDFNLIRKLAHGAYVEVGTFYGGSAVAASPSAGSVLTIDIYEWLPHLWDGLDLGNITFFKGTSLDFVEEHPGFEIDTLFIDGGHEYIPVKKDVEALVPLVKRGGLIMFHDYNPGSDADVARVVDDYIKEQNPEMVKEAIPGIDVLLVLKKR